MNLLASDPFAERLYYEDSLPVCWRQLEEYPDESRITHINESNESLLRISGALDEYLPDVAEEYPEITPELARLDLKLNLVLEFVGQLLGRELGLPSPTPVRIGAKGLAIHHEGPLDDTLIPGQKLSLDLYIQAEVPKPLKLFGEIVERSEKQGTHIIVIAFYGINQSLEDWLEKLVFRHHRRDIAQQRDTQPES